MPNPLAATSYVPRGRPVTVTAWSGPRSTTLIEPFGSLSRAARPTEKPNRASRTSILNGKSRALMVHVEEEPTKKLWLPPYTTFAPSRMTSRAE